MRHQYGSPSNRLFYPPKWIKCDVALRKRGGGKGGGKEGGLEGTWLTFLLIKMSHLDFINPFNPFSD